jgi:hypothetical protein
VFLDCGGPVQPVRAMSASDPSGRTGASQATRDALDAAAAVICGQAVGGLCATCRAVAREIVLRYLACVIARPGTVRPSTPGSLWADLVLRGSDA